MEPLILITLFVLYFAPSIVAVVRQHHQTAAIFLVNLFLGWTFLGWVIALVWSATASTGGTGFKTCPKCAEQVQEAARVCRYCNFEFVPNVSHKEDSLPVLGASGESQEEGFQHTARREKEEPAANAPDILNKLQTAGLDRIVEPPERQADVSGGSTNTIVITIVLIVVGLVGTLAWFAWWPPTERVEQVGQSPPGSSKKTVENALPLRIPIRDSKSTRLQESTLQEKELVRQVQTQLTSLGYNPGPVDGVMGSKTMAAIEAFQKANGMMPDGRPSNSLLSQLRRRSTGTRVFGPSVTDVLPTAQTSIDVGKIPKPTKIEARAALSASVAELNYQQRRELTVFGIKAAFGLKIGPSDIKEDTTGHELEEMIATGLNGNGLLCAKILSVRALTLKGKYEVRCIAYRGGSASKTYIVSALEGIAFEE